MQKSILLFLKGIFMGLCDLVPGISGGSAALITGIYPRLIKAISHIDFTLCKFCLRGQWRQAYIYLDTVFLLHIFVGIALALFLGVHAIDYLLSSHQEFVYAIFISLISFSGTKTIAINFRWSGLYIGCIFLGCLCGISLMFLQPYTLIVNSTGLFIVGFVASCIMLLPGISASFILLLFGIYQPTIEAIKHFDISYLAPLSLGVILGMILGAKSIGFLIHRYKILLVFLAAFMLGSIGVIWRQSGIDSIYVLGILLTIAIVYSIWHLKKGRYMMLFILCAITIGCVSTHHSSPIEYAIHKLQVDQYIVQPGDTLNFIAFKYSKDIKDLRSYNKLYNKVIKIGQVIYLNKPDKNHIFKSKNIDTKSRSRSKIKLVSGKNITKDNIAQYVGKTPSAWRYPILNPKIIPNRLRSQQGMTISTAIGSPVKAMAEGIVVYQGKSLSSYGHLILIKHSDTFVSAYAYNQKSLVKKGDIIKLGQVISKSGKIPYTQKPALYVEIRKRGKLVNIKRYLP